METQESKDLVVRKPKKLGYVFLIFVFIASIAGSIYFFSEGKLGEFVSQKGKETQTSYDFGKHDTTLLPSGEEKLSGETESHIVLGQSGEKNETEENFPIVSTLNEDGTIHYFANNRQLDKNKPMVALTFDDGPDPKRTPQIIDILNQYHVRATFFDIGDLMERNPETLKKEVASGCDVGGHTYSHVDLNVLTPDEIREEIGKMEDVFRSITGQELKFIRPTYGNANATVRATVNRPLINWCVDSLDWKSRDTDKILEEIYQTKDFDGKIIIMHCIYDTTVEAVKKLVPELIERGYQLVTISEMAEYKGYTFENGKIYYQF